MKLLQRRKLCVNVRNIRCNLFNFILPISVVEPLIVFGFAYMSYILSDMFEFSGIISIITCGIVQAHYTFLNVTKKSRLAIKFLSKVMS